MKTPLYVAIAGGLLLCGTAHAQSLTVDMISQSGLKASGLRQVAASVSPRDASKTPVVAKVGQTFAVTLDPKEQQDFNFDLPAGKFLILVDGEAVGEDANRIFGELSLLKRNGAQIPAYGSTFAFWYGNEKIWRAGKPLTLTKPLGARLRLRNVHNDVPTNYWVKIVPAASGFVPFGFGAPVTAAKVGSSNGAGGTLESKELAFQRASLPAGKWNISLGAQSDTSRVYATLIVLDARGLPTNYDSLITAADDFGGEARKEMTITLTKPTTLIFRVWNEGAADHEPCKYDITIEKG